MAVADVKGIVGNGAIISYASGAPITLTNDGSSAMGTGAIVGFGNSLSGVVPIGVMIDVTNLDNYAFSMPRRGIITSLSASFTLKNMLALLGSNLIIEAQLYQSILSNKLSNPMPEPIFPIPGDLFYPIQSAVVPLALAGVPINGVIKGITTSLNIEVPAESRLLMVFSIPTRLGPIQSTPAPVYTQSVTGYASAGVAIQ